MNSKNQPAADIVTSTIPEGWDAQGHGGTFSAHAGPFYFRDAKSKTPGIGFYSLPHHANPDGVIHGGMLLTLADMSLWDICRRVIGPFKAVTVTLNAEFVGPGPVGAFIEATGEPVRLGRKMLFARGLVRAGDQTLMSFSGTLKRLD